MYLTACGSSFRFGRSVAAVYMQTIKSSVIFKHKKYVRLYEG